MGASVETLISKSVAVTHNAIGSKMAAGLSAIYLPPLPPPVATPVTRRQPGTARKVPLPEGGRQPEKKPLRTSLRLFRYF